MLVEDVVIVGGGAAGVLVTAYLSRLTTRPIRVTVVDAGPARLGAGVAYSTDDPAHLLNVRTSNLSAWSDQPDHFTNWLAQRGTPALPSAYVERRTYGAYLAAVASDALNGPVAHVHPIHAKALDLHRSDANWRVRLSDGTTLTSRHVVLATGVGVPSPIRAALNRPRYIADPWRTGALDAIGDRDSVLVIGTGLTAVDIATTLGRGNRRLVAISRHGLIPAAHTVYAPTPMPFAPDAPTGLADLRRHMRHRIATSMDATGDWRPAVDGVRPHTQRLWQALEVAEKHAFLERDRRRWEVARHRMAPRVAAAIADMRASGQLTVRSDNAAAAIAAAGPDTWIVNATGPDPDLTRCPDPLMQSLFRSGYARPGPCGIGFATTGIGQLAGTPGLWTLGSPRRGDLWESSAIPEIREQARDLAVALLPTRLLATLKG